MDALEWPCTVAIQTEEIDVRNHEYYLDYEYLEFGNMDEANEAMMSRGFRAVGPLLFGKPIKWRGNDVRASIADLYFAPSRVVEMSVGYGLSRFIAGQSFTAACRERDEKMAAEKTS